MALQEQGVAAREIAHSVEKVAQMTETGSEASKRLLPWPIRSPDWRNSIFEKGEDLAPGRLRSGFQIRETFLGLEVCRFPATPDGTTWASMMTAFSSRLRPFRVLRNAELDAFFLQPGNLGRKHLSRPWHR